MTNARSRFLAGALGLAALAALRPLSAQQSPSLTPGQRVRVSFLSSAIKQQVALVGSVSEGSITLIVPGDSQSHAGAATHQLAVPLDSLASLDRSRGFRSHQVAGAIIGAVALGAAGAGGFGKGLFYTCGGGFAPDCDFARVIGAAGGVAAGALVGWAVGWLVRTEQWEPVVLRRAHVLVAALPAGRLGVGTRLAF